MADAAAGQVSPHPVLFPFRMVSSAPSARLVVLLAYTLLYFSGTVSTADVPDTSSSCANEGWEAYDPRQPVPEPGIPDPLPTLDFAVALDYSGNAVGAGTPVKGSFLGLSISLPFVEALIGRNSTWMRPEFLNLMSTLHERGGPPVLRIGGNSQEKAYIVDSIEEGRHSTHCDAAGATYSPSLLYTKDIFVAMRTASDLLGINWILGLPMNQTEPARLQVAEAAEPALGDSLLSWQLGNEPDLYPNSGLRPAGYDAAAYMVEYASIINQMKANPNLKSPPRIGGPSLCECNTGWTTADLINNHGWLTQFRENINMINVMRYPADNCGTDELGNRPPAAETDARTVQLFDEFSHHSGSARSVKTFASRYTTLAALAQSNNLPLVMLETNTASCNGFLGLSDSFLSTLWTLDLGLQLASTGFSNMMLHLGGQRAYYNAFMSPPWNATAPNKWTVMAQFYAILVSSEALGPSGNARVVDMGINNNDTQMVGYTVFENNQPVRLVFINYMTDSGSGALAYTARVAAKDVSRVRVRYLSAGKLTDKFGITYASQGFGGYFESDGLLKGEQKTEEVACDAGVCAIKVPAPSVAVVFLTDDLIFDASAGDAVKTFGTNPTTTSSGGSDPANPSSTPDGALGGHRWGTWTIGSVVGACVVGAWAILA